MSTSAEPTVGGRGWRGLIEEYRQHLPVSASTPIVTLHEGGTPLLPAPRLSELTGARVWLKFEGANPTGSFKDRGMTVAISKALEEGAKAVVCGSTGNTSASAAAYAARAGMPATVFAPRDTPSAIVRQIQAFGAALELVDGHIGDCGRRAAALAERTGAALLSTLREPYRIEGKKTLGLEIAEQLGWRLPDAVVYPAGGGTGLIAMWLAFRELLAAGWAAGPLPRLFAVQAAGCAPLVRALDEGEDRCSPWPEPLTAAHGLRVPAPLGGRLMLRAIRETRGGAVAVSDGRLLAQAALGNRLEGMDFCPEGGATLAGVAELRARGLIHPADWVVAFNTGGGWLYR